MKVLKVFLWIAVIAVTGYWGYRAWVEIQRDATVAEELAELRAARDTAFARAHLLTQENTRLAAASDSIQRVLEEAAERAREREEKERLRADSLSAEIVELVPEGEVRDRVAAAVTALRQSYERRLDDLEGLLAISEDRGDALEARALAAERVSAHLADALRVTEAERDVYRRALEPGWRERLKQNARLVGGTAVVSVLLTVAVML